jgi:PadR family transcriptional regulator PadR
LLEVFAAKETKQEHFRPGKGRESLRSAAIDRSAKCYILLYNMTGEERPEDGRRAQLLKGVAELALLSLLGEGPQYGLEILERLRTEAGVELAAGTIYPLLHRLERGKLTRSEWRIEDDGARPRKYYALTDLGREEFASQLAEWRRLAKALNAFLDRRRMK